MCHGIVKTVNKVKTYHLQRSGRQRISVFLFRSCDDGEAEEERKNCKCTDVVNKWYSIGKQLKFFNRFPSDISKVILKY